MSWHQDNYSMSSMPFDQTMHADVHASGPEAQSSDFYHSSYAPPYHQPLFASVDSFQGSVYNNSAFEPMQYYPNSPVPLMMAADYVPGVPFQPVHFDSQTFDPVSHDMVQNAYVPLEFSQNSSYNHKNQRARTRDRGRGNMYRGNKRGFGQPHSNFQSYDRNLEYNNYPAQRGNYRGHRGYQAMSFQNRNRRYDNGDNNHMEGYSRQREMQKHNPNYGQDSSRIKDTSRPIHDENKDSDSGNVRSNTTQDAQVASSQEQAISKGFREKGRENWKSNNSGRKHEYNVNNPNSRKSGNDYASKKEKGNVFGGQMNYNNRGARPKQGRKWDSQMADKDESQRGSLTEQLSSNAYECMVCCEIIKVESSIWSCQNCYHVFHLHCTKKWAHSSVDKDTNLWRCPGCQNESSQIPTQYRCFCGRRRDPTYIRGETPHSCGEACRKKRKGHCKHPCTILCHPGPCPPCSSMVNQPCDCEKQRKSMRCSVASSFKCDAVCSKILSCEEHECSEICHSGICETCTVFKMQGCYCGKGERSVMCGTSEFKTVSYSCEENCGKTLSCGNHVCEVACHPGECAPCSFDPIVMFTCCCGKTPFAQLNAEERHSCLDPIPICGKICNKPMACGPENCPHICGNKCHEGDCGPCNKETLVSCQCGTMRKDFPCETAIAFNETNPFKCQKRCGKKKNCGRHKCSDNCCVKDFHICEYICGLKLSCGVHKCKEMCHRGNCKRCLETSYDELSCYCGATVMEPPIPCGTKPPECRQLCPRPQECGHPVRHNCHTDDDCAPCTELTEITCMGGHMIRKNIPCHMKNISCGMPCKKELPCGIHYCLKVCHKGPCLTEGATCTQTCPNPRTACGHPCGAPCHSGDCPSTFCKTEIVITCRCGNRSTKMECRMGGDQSAEIAQFQRLTVQSFAQSGSEGMDLAHFNQTKPGSRKLDCDTTCAVLERNKRLALALEVKNPDMSAKLGNPTFTDFLKDFGKKNPSLAINVEKALGNLVLNAKKSSHQSRSHSFPSMNRDQRRFVHELAEFYGCQTQSYDFDPNKNVVSTAYRDRCWLPNVKLSQILFKDQSSKAPPPLSGMKSLGVTFTVLEKKKPAAPPVNEPPPPSRAWETVSSSKPASESSSATKSTASPTMDYFDFTEK